MAILGKKQMSEEDIKLNYITPVILKGWKGHITMETKITDGRINIRGNIVARSKPKFADYMLYLEINPLPGLAPNYSDFPMAAEAVGLSYDDLIAAVAESALSRIEK